MRCLRVILAMLLMGFVSGCSLFGTRPAATQPTTAPALARSESLQQMDPVRIQADTMGFADRFVTSMAGVCDEMERASTTPAARDAAHQLKTDIALGAISNAVNPRPVAGLMDMVVLVTLLREIAGEPWAAQTYGEQSSLLLTSLKQKEADVQGMAKQYLTDAQLAELTALAKRWHREHLDERSVSHVHLANLPEANRTPEQHGKGPSSLFALLFLDPTPDLDPAVREIEMSRATSERMFFYLQRLPLLLQLQGEGFYRQMLEAPQFKRAMADTTAVASATTRFAETGSQFTDIIGRFPQQLTEQRDAAIHQLAQAVATEREAAIAQATTRISAEREQAIQQIASTIRQEHELFVANLESATDRSINRLVWRLATAVAILLALVIGSEIAYRALAHRRAQHREHPA